MGTKTRVQLEEARARVRELEAEEETGDGTGAIHVHVHTNDKATTPVVGKEGEEEEGEGAKTLDKAIDERFTKIESAVAGFGETLKAIEAAVKAPKANTEAEEVTDAEGKGPTRDSAALATSFTEFVSQAEILLPGFRVPTFDSAAPRAATVDSMCAGRRSVLLAAYATKDGKSLIDGITGQKELDLAKVDCSGVALTFRAAATAKGAMNNRAATGDGKTVPDQSQDKTPKRLTLAEINERTTAYWAERTAKA